jgi:hypothetical protein
MRRQDGDVVVTSVHEVAAPAGSDGDDLICRGAVGNLLGLVPGLLRTPQYARQVLLAARVLHGGKDDIDNVVVTEDLISERVISDPGGVETYGVACDELWGVAAEGEQLRSILVGASNELSAR